MGEVVWGGQGEGRVASIGVIPFIRCVVVQHRAFHYLFHCCTFIECSVLSFFFSVTT